MDNRWCLADFGISRFADATTAPDTRKFSKTPAYAAPEQWRDERATSATDVCLRIIAYELVTGRRPFAALTCLICRSSTCRLRRRCPACR